MIPSFIVLLGVVGLVVYTSRTAVERGRSGVGWGTLSVAGGLLGELIGLVAFGSAAAAPATSFSAGGILLATVALILAPLGCMVAVLGILSRLPESVPTLRGSRWPMHRMSSPEHPGGECMLAIENGRLLLDRETIEPKDLSSIATDGECLQLAWAGKSILLLPVGPGQTPRIRAKQSLALEKRLRSLRG
jgi:hypothetical protein